MSRVGELLTQTVGTETAIQLGGGLRQSVLGAPTSLGDDRAAAHAADLLSTTTALGQHLRDWLAQRLEPAVLALPDDAEIEAVEQLIDRLGADSRLIAFFASGDVSLASQAVAQFAGWNIPGVGEGDQRFRPRTRLYDTLDPDTITQVCDSIAYERTAFVFIGTPPIGPSLAWAEALMPAATAALGDVVGDRIVVVVDVQGPDDEPLRACITAAGGEVVTVGAGHGLAAAPLLVAAARGMDLRAIRKGAEAAAETLREGLQGDAGAALLLWPVLVGALANETGGGTALQLLALTDRLSRASIWAASAWAVKGPAYLSAHASPQAVSGLNPAQLGLGDGCGSDASRTCAPGLVDLHGVDVAGTDRIAIPYCDAVARFCGVVGSGDRIVRQLVVQDYDAACYGAFAMRIALETETARHAAKLVADTP